MIAMGKPPLKSTKALIKAELVAKAKFQASTLGIQTALIDSLQDMIAKIDPLELAGITATAIVVKNFIQGTEELAKAAKTIVNQMADNLANPTPKAALQAVEMSSGVFSLLALRFPDQAKALNAWLLNEVEGKTGGGAR